MSLRTKRNTTIHAGMLDITDFSYAENQIQQRNNHTICKRRRTNIVQYGNRKKIKITKHAKQRCIERCPSLSVNNLSSIAYAARYNGLSIADCEENLKNFLNNIYKGWNPKRVRIFNDIVFIFAGDHGHCRTLITMYPVPEEYVQIEDLKESIM